MLQSLSLRMRLSLLLGAVLALGLALGVGLLILHAGARVRAEADGATRLARELAEATLTRLETAVDPKAEIARLLADAQRLRHVRVALEGAEAAPPATDNRAPQWFATLALPKAAVTRVETPRGAAIIIAANPADEIAEIWQEIIWLAIGGAGIAAAAFALVSLAVSRTLRPVATLAEGLRRLERGDHCDARSRRRLAGIRRHRRTHQRAGRNSAKSRRREPSAGAPNDPCPGRRAS